MSTKVITSEVRFSYLHVFEPASINENSPKKYSASLIIPKKDKVLVAKIEAAIKEAFNEGIAKTFGGKAPKNWKNPLRDGDEEREDDENYKDSFFVNANSTNKPGLVDENVDPIMDKDDLYSGAYGRASINFYAFNNSGNVGVACGLNNLQKLRDGDRLSGGGASAQEDFGSEQEDPLA